MRIESYIERGFVKVATISKSKPEHLKVSKHGTYTLLFENLHKRSGVYLLVVRGDIMKIGESINMDNRLLHYRVGTQPGNLYVRESMSDDEDISVYFIDCHQEEIWYAGVRTTKGVSYRDLEKALIREYISSTGKLPAWNKGVQ